MPRQPRFTVGDVQCSAAEDVRRAMTDAGADVTHNTVVSLLRVLNQADQDSVSIGGVTVTRLKKPNGGSLAFLVKEPCATEIAAGGSSASATVVEHALDEKPPIAMPFAEPEPKHKRAKKSTSHKTPAPSHTEASPS